jgi:hypothetical protein
MPRDDDAMRYRHAAHLALSQLDWCVTYFRSIRKTRISRQIARNRAAIARRLEEGSEDVRGRPQR